MQEIDSPEYYFICPPGRERDWNGSGYYFETKNSLVGPYSIGDVKAILEIAEELRKDLSCVEPPKGV